MGECGVCIGGGDYDGFPEFYEITWPKARKPHRCIECRHTIPVGAEYERVAGKYDGDFYCDHTCAVCAEIRTAFTCDEGPAVVGELWSELSMVQSSINTGCFERLSTVEAKAYLREQVNRWRGLV